ncbi:MAG: NFACT RNA binding domain-containing protein [Pseudanabaenaceae cyanobacterium SKYGB_i_bin29]|nr:NFACT family protein [Pseudanabaenaceae cyanobacterium SKYG29]MDW8421510.1 NFACT RNA binding domain-containing protein [Pseudanabaenaceae cyanobacterium SKYGB_i_bin29]
MQPVDYTTLALVVGELNNVVVPARLEQVRQTDRFTLYLALKTVVGRRWLTCSWHPQAARLHLSQSVPKLPDTFTFSQQIWHQVGGLALVGVRLPQPWERVVVLEFAPRPQAPILWSLYLEIMGKHSNAILVNHNNTIVTAAHQVSPQQSRPRPILTGENYVFPPSQLLPSPNLAESFTSWQERLAVLEEPIAKVLFLRYRGLGKHLAEELCQRAGITPGLLTSQLHQLQWQALWQSWQFWLHCLSEHKYSWQEWEKSYSVLPKEENDRPNISLSQQLEQYYTRYLQLETGKQLAHRLHQIVSVQQQKLTEKIKELQTKLQQSEQADTIKHQADLLMANLHLVSHGVATVRLRDFGNDGEVEIKLDPALTPSQNAQKLYKVYQKQKRARDVIRPLLQKNQQELDYLSNIDTALTYLEGHELELLKEIQQELIENGYGKVSEMEFYRPPKAKPDINCYRYPTPQGNEVWIGRNNFQNDSLTFKIATDYDLWFHALEIPGSHVLLRLKPGQEPDREELEFAANLAAFYSKARYSDQVAVIYTKPRCVFKPKGAKPGMVVYKNETLIWARPHLVSLPDNGGDRI